MTRMERRRRRRRILRIKLATTAAVLALTTASIVPEHIMSAKDCAYIFDVCAAGRVEDAREMLGRFVTAHVAK